MLHHTLEAEQVLYADFSLCNSDLWKGSRLVLYINFNKSHIRDHSLFICQVGLKRSIYLVICFVTQPLRDKNNIPYPNSTRKIIYPAYCSSVSTEEEAQNN